MLGLGDLHYASRVDESGKVEQLRLALKSWLKIYKNLYANENPYNSAEQNDLYIKNAIAGARELYTIIKNNEPKS